jgi:hypothetical protein
MALLDAKEPRARRQKRTFAERHAAVSGGERR